MAPANQVRIRLRLPCDAHALTWFTAAIIVLERLGKGPPVTVVDEGTALVADAIVVPAAMHERVLEILWHLREFPLGSTEPEGGARAVEISAAD